MRRAMDLAMSGLRELLDGAGARECECFVAGMTRAIALGLERPAGEEISGRRQPWHGAMTGADETGESWMRAAVLPLAIFAPAAGIHLGRSA
jgi:hypothetical protein